jgi:hypothetical protein
MKEFLHDEEVATFYRVSVKTILNSLKAHGNYNGIVPKVVGGGEQRKYRLWKVSDIAEQSGVAAARVVEAAI